jgi:hypothetical protein
MQKTIRRNVVKAAIMRQIFCPNTGECLDVKDAYLVTNLATRQVAIITGTAWRGLVGAWESDGTEWAKLLEVWDGKGNDVSAVRSAEETRLD